MSGHSRASLTTTPPPGLTFPGAQGLTWGSRGSRCIMSEVPTVPFSWGWRPGDTWLSVWQSGDLSGVGRKVVLATEKQGTKPDRHHHCGGSHCKEGGRAFWWQSLNTPGHEHPPTLLDDHCLLKAGPNPLPGSQTQRVPPSACTWGWKARLCREWPSGQAAGPAEAWTLPGWNASSDPYLPEPEHPGPSSQLKGDLGAACPMDSATPSPSTGGS